MTLELTKGLKRLITLCGEQGKIVEQTLDIHERMKMIDDNQVAVAPKLEETMELYKKAYLAATDEMVCVSDLLEKTKRVIRRRGNKRLSPTPGADAKKARKTAVATPRALDIWAHSHTVLANGSEVAGLVDEESKPNLWILASILSFKPGTREDRTRYEVLDEDPGDEENPHPIRKKYSLHPRKIIPLPSLELVPLGSRREFSLDERVLALYPGATVLYPARIRATPRKTKSPNYHCTFEDDEEIVTIVDARYVCPLPTD